MKQHYRIKKYASICYEGECYGEYYTAEVRFLGFFWIEIDGCCESLDEAMRVIQKHALSHTGVIVKEIQL